MTKQQLSEAMKIAQSNAFLSTHSTSLFIGCALYGFKPITITIEMLASFLRWHVINLDGSIDANELNNVASYGRLAFCMI